MPAQFRITVEGFEELQQRVSSLPEKLRGPIMRGAMRAALVELRKLARRYVLPKRTGALYRSIRVSARSFRDGALIGKVTAGGPGAQHANLIERGTKPHRIVAKRARALTIGDGRMVRSVRHPGHAGRHFMARAAAEGARPASDAFSAYVHARIQRHMAAGGLVP